MGLDFKVNAIFFHLTQEQIDEVIGFVGKKCAETYDIVKLNSFDADRRKLDMGQNSDLRLEFGVACQTWRTADYKAREICAQVTRKTMYPHNIIQEPVGK